MPKLTDYPREEHWRIMLADTECPFRLMADEKLGNNIYFCSKRTKPEDIPYCTFNNCRIKEI